MSPNGSTHSCHHPPPTHTHTLPGFPWGSCLSAHEQMGKTVSKLLTPTLPASSPSPQVPSEGSSLASSFLLLFLLPSPRLSALSEEGLGATVSPFVICLGTRVCPVGHRMSVHLGEVSSLEGVASTRPYLARPPACAAWRWDLLPEPLRTSSLAPSACPSCFSLPCSPLGPPETPGSEVAVRPQ